MEVALDRSSGVVFERAISTFPSTGDVWLEKDENSLTAFKCVTNTEVITASEDAPQTAFFQFHRLFFKSFLINEKCLVRMSAKAFRRVFRGGESALTHVDSITLMFSFRQGRLVAVPSKSRAYSQTNSGLPVTLGNTTEVHNDCGFPAVHPYVFLQA